MRRSRTSAWSTNEGGGGNVRPSSSRDSMVSCVSCVSVMPGPPSVLRGGGQAIPGCSRTIRAGAAGRGSDLEVDGDVAGRVGRDTERALRVETDHPGDHTFEVLRLLDLAHDRGVD